MASQGDLALLMDPVAQNLLKSREPARLAYSWTDGSPRVVPIWFHWNGRQVVLAGPTDAPKVKALRKEPTGRTHHRSGIHVAIPRAHGSRASPGRRGRRYRAGIRPVDATLPRRQTRCGVGRAGRQTRFAYDAHCSESRMGRDSGLRGTISQRDCAQDVGSHHVTPLSAGDFKKAGLYPRARGATAQLRRPAHPA